MLLMLSLSAPEVPAPVLAGTPGTSTARAASTKTLASLTRLVRSASRGIRRVFVEAGPSLVSAIVAAGYADEYAVYLAPALLGGDHVAIGDLGIPTVADAVRLRLDSVEQLGDDLLITASPRTRPIPQKEL